jgi:diaminopimelate decarboxylase
LRCHVELEDGRRSRFGLATDELTSAHQRLAKLPGCELVGLHVHQSTRRDEDSFRRRAEHLVAAAHRLFGDSQPAILDIGGGLYGPMPPELRRQFVGDVPGWDDVAATVTAVLAKAYGGTAAPELVIEPGVGVVAVAVRFVCRVAAVKRLPSAAVAVVTGSVQDVKPRRSALRLPLTVVPGPTGALVERIAGPLDVTGYTCMEDDMLVDGYDGDLGVGDFLVFGHVGAYTSVFRPPFIRPAPPMLILDRATETLGVARRGETLDDILATYALRDTAPTSA